MSTTNHSEKITKINSKTVFEHQNFTPEEEQFLIEKLEKIELKRGNFLLRNDDKVTHQYYVESGCLRTYFIDDSGKEHTLQFAIHDWWISDYTAFFSEEMAILILKFYKTAFCTVFQRKIWTNYS